MAKRKRKQSKDESVSNAMVAILLILTIVVSVIGTWSVLQSADNVQAQASVASGNTEGKVKVWINQPGDASHQTSSTGKVQMGIIR